MQKSLGFIALLLFRVMNFINSQNEETKIYI